MDFDIFIQILIAAIAAGTPFVYAALGELITEKSGVLNLGVEGMMLVGAISGFIAMAKTGSLLFAVLCGMTAGALMAGIFAVLTLTLMANQVASGLALTIFGVGLSAFLGLEYTSIALPGVPEIHIPMLADIPVIGQLFFSFDILIYFSGALFVAISWFLYKSKSGLILRGIGEAPKSAHALGYNVIKIRYMAVLFGGAMAGLGGTYLSVAYTPMWVEGMVAGRGWVSLALVVFATWRPARVMFGAYLFGAITIAQFHVQGFGIDIPAQLLSMLPYVATIIVLVFISRDQNTIRLNSPASLGITYHPDNQ
ncbi:MAG: ABC transporter permease [Thermodesulfobacteriota bacterium]|nr:ABC transporter permease [Thermodesulfobacteriota bacterium]